MDERKRSGHLRRSRRGGLAISTGLVALVTLLLLAAPLTSATTPQKVYTAPYTGQPASGTLMGTVGCGGSLSVGSWPAFNLTTGIGSAWLNVSAKHCPDLSGSDSAVITAFAGYNGSAFTQAKSGSHSVATKFSFTWKASVTAKPSPSTQAVDADVDIYAIVALEDWTNDTSPTSGFASILSLVTTSGTVSSSKTNDIFYANTTATKLVKNHHYTIEVIVYIDLSATVPSSGKSTASASLNLASSGSKFNLVSVTVH
jgi:hypothetical protein